MFCFEWPGHPMVRETTAKNVHQFSKLWFRNGTVDGLGSGSCFRELDGSLIRLP
ncbi:hypothetical protein [Streptomyces sp. HM190]|uniref:hypothetical protein n=1 Tax=Streptomyces sp. HM190 TaxID=2695266 RepID=UPI00135C0EC7|nr:hypothetical protein [Streptomyces sp. HM190]